MVRKRNKQIASFLLLSCALICFKTVEAQCLIIKEIRDNSNLALEYNFQLNSGVKAIPFELEVICMSNTRTHDGYPLKYSVLDDSTPA